MSESNRYHLPCKGEENRRGCIVFDKDESGNIKIHSPWFFKDYIKLEISKLDADELMNFLSWRT